ncbi:GntR family transcriptional regulator [Streptomyces griseus]|uniref:GntR family transcriptional regulator n=1 Tax=Streptomyces griseus TaxID=1911 RepID=UPI00099D09D5|nr:GntR family transcriptional regulator [Streptomyces griseus]
MGDLKQHSLIKAQERLRDQVGHALRAALTAGELKPGTVYSAPGLAAELGVSATPVREAMLDLAREGLVEPVRNKGFRITEVSERELDQCTELRALIEVPTVGRVTETATTEELEALRPLAEEIVSNAREHNLIGYLEADRQFHLTLLGLSGNDRLVQTVGDLRKPSSTSPVSSTRPSRPRRSDPARTRDPPPGPPPPTPRSPTGRAPPPGGCGPPCVAGPGGIRPPGPGRSGTRHRRRAGRPG